MQKPFTPLLPGVDHVAVGDLDGLRQVVSDATCGIIVEPIQGEGGVNVVPDAFLRELRRLCDHHKALLIFDEVQVREEGAPRAQGPRGVCRPVPLTALGMLRGTASTSRQCGLGRTGKLWAHEWVGVTPDVMTLAKALGNGIPIGAICATERVAEGAFLRGHREPASLLRNALEWARQPARGAPASTGCASQHGVRQPARGRGALASTGREPARTQPRSSLDRTILARPNPTPRSTEPHSAHDRSPLHLI